MFARLFTDSGLSLDRLRALVEVGAAGSIARAAEGDPIRQSQFSRQIKELEDFFQTKGTDGPLYRYHLAWNPRLLRLNPHATRQRDFLLASLAKGVLLDNRPSPSPSL